MDFWVQPTGTVLSLGCLGFGATAAHRGLFFLIGPSVAVVPFRMSINEWNLAKKCHASGGRDVYVLAVVTSVTRKPRLAELIVDPVGKVASGAATCEVWEMVFTPSGGARADTAAAEVAETGSGHPPALRGRDGRGSRGGRPGAKGGAGGEAPFIR